MLSFGGTPDPEDAGERPFRSQNANESDRSDARQGTNWEALSSKLGCAATWQSS